MRLYLIKYLPRPVKDCLKKFYVLVVTKISGFFGFYLPLEANSTIFLMAVGGWERGTKKIFKRLIRRGDVFVDVGAHVGYYSAYVSRLVGPKGQVFSFEPSPINFPLLKKNTGQLKNVVANNLAVGDSIGEICFYQSKKGSGRHSLVQGRCDDVEELKVPVVTLDDYFSEINPDVIINLLKIDVEGFEPEVLVGAKKLLSEKRIKKLIFECYPTIYPQNRKHLLVDFISNLMAAGYQLSWIEEKRGQIIPIEGELQLFISKIEKTVNLVAMLP